MIDKSELRKGNIVGVEIPVDLRLGRIISIHGNKVRLQMKASKITTSISQLIPIPLVEEIHEWLGVEKNGFGNFEYDISKHETSDTVLSVSEDYVMIRQENNGRAYDDDLITIYNKDMQGQLYTHYFQNLYYHLTGKEI